MIPKKIGDKPVQFEVTIGEDFSCFVHIMIIFYDPPLCLIPRHILMNLGYIWPILDEPNTSQTIKEYQAEK